MTDQLAKIRKERDELRLGHELYRGLSQSLRERAEYADAEIARLQQERDEQQAAFEAFMLECARAYGAGHVSTPEIVGIVARLAEGWSCRATQARP